ncbi:hypothetical protein N7491_009883 [Penicillium cf. griseofulvum]|uniref:Rhodopsin domain-containing protein n=1 Tax=Penicillium cf. griseofulvum TaxID=2972120 RepID=A0A9W9MYU3_9EURO|nr:hypothetical protein N7472_000210 [Penicillium cf. griseofulvum]KAJ5421438.1 hypothetical protein N7491_009883 [Penicillium cf. griseofulvum]KAJ5424669.1 hypothetical protein N7445_010642 [Penicillium cf. griseofulvum]
MDLTPPPGIDLNESHQTELYAKYSGTYGLAVVAVILRLLCRLKVSKANLWWDDYIMCVALAFATGNYIDMIIWVHRGVGRHIYPLGQTGVSHFYLNLFVCEILYTLALCCTKYSILLFFWRIFNRTNIRIPICIIASLVTGWGLGVIITTVLQCIPLRGLWDYSITAKCGVNINNFFIGNAVPNIFTDWALLILPMPSRYVEPLQWEDLVMLDSYKTPSVDVTWVFIGPSTWTAVETNIGIVSACLPSLGPFIRYITRKAGRKDTTEDDTHKLSNWYASASSKSGDRSCYDNHTDRIDVTTSVDVQTYRRHSDNMF